MKKRLITVCLAAMLLVSICVTTVSANDSLLQIADNFNTVFYQDSTYVLVENGDAIDYEHCITERDIVLTARQEAKIQNVTATVDMQRDYYVVLDVHYKDGTYDSNRTYVAVHRLQEYEDLLNGIGHSYAVTIDYSKDERIVMTESQLKGEGIAVEGELVKFTNEFPIWITNESGTFSVIGGGLLVDEKTEDYYFLDYYQFGVTEKDGFVRDVTQYDRVTLYCITDETLLAQLDTDYMAYYNEQLLPYTETQGKTLSAVMMMLIFGIVPLAVLVIAVIGCIRTKKAIYRRMFIGMTALGVAELAVFIAVCILCAK